MAGLNLGQTLSSAGEIAESRNKHQINLQLERDNQIKLNKKNRIEDIENRDIEASRADIATPETRKDVDVVLDPIKAPKKAAPVKSSKTIGGLSTSSKSGSKSGTPSKKVA